MIVKFLKRSIFYLVLLISLLNTSCKEDEVILDTTVCDYEVLIDKNQYDNLNSDNFNFMEAEVDEDCLILKIGASGCSGNSWEFELVDSGTIAESFPEQRYLKFKLVNKEACLAVFTKTISFDLKALQISGSNRLILHIDGLGQSLIYEY